MIQLKNKRHMDSFTILPSEIAMDILYKFKGLEHPIATLFKPHIKYAFYNISECYRYLVELTDNVIEFEEYYLSSFFDSVVHHAFIDSNKYPNHQRGQIYYKGTCTVNPNILCQ